MHPDLEQRVLRLERQNERLRRTAFVLCAFAMGAVLISARHDTIPDQLVAHSLRVVGKHGKNDVVLAATDDGFVGLFMRDLNGDQPFFILITPSGKPTIAFGHGHGSARLDLGVVDDGAVGEEFSIRLLNADHSVVWQPPVHNPLAASVPDQK